MNFQMEIWVFQILEKWMAVSHNVDNVTAGRSSRMLCTAESGENQLAWHPSANSLCCGHCATLLVYLMLHCHIINEYHT